MIWNLCVHDVLIDGEDIANVIQPTMLKKLFVAPATIQLAGAEVELVGIVSRETILKKPLLLYAMSMILSSLIARHLLVC